MGTARSTNMAVTCLKPSEYRGAESTAVAGRIVILKQQEIQSRKGPQVAAAPAGGKRGKGNKAGKGLPECRTLGKLEAHLAATQSLSEVLYVKTWGENRDKLAQKCQVGDLVSVQGAAVVAACSCASAIPYLAVALQFESEGTLGTTGHCAEAR